MIRDILHTLGFFGLVKVLFMYPLYVTAQKVFEKENRKQAEMMGMTFEEYRESLIIYRGVDGKPLTKESEIEAARKRFQAQSRAYALEELKKKYGYKDF